MTREDVPRVHQGVEDPPHQSDGWRIADTTFVPQCADTRPAASLPRIGRRTQPQGVIPCACARDNAAVWMAIAQDTLHFVWLIPGGMGDILDSVIGDSDNSQLV